MSTFSERYGYVVKPLQLESMTIELRNRIWNIYRCEICNDIAVIDSHYLEEIMDACGLSYTSVNYLIEKWSKAAKNQDNSEV